MAAVKIKPHSKKKVSLTADKQFILNVRSEILKKPLYKRSKKAITALKELTARAMHTDVKHVKICPALNQLVWSQGKHNPPTKYKLHSTMQNEFALVELHNVAFPVKKEKTVKQDSKSLKDKITEKFASKEAQSKTTETNKELKKEELAIEKKEHLHEVHSAPDKISNPQAFKADGVGAINQDKKKKIGEQ